jgi:hypothetical protein
MTTLACLDGNILSLAMSGSLASFPIMVVTGLTCIAGVGAWTSAINEYGGNKSEYKKKLLITTALISISLVTITSFIGSMINVALNMEILRYFSALAVFVIGLEVAGVNLPEKIPMTPIPTTIAIIFTGIMLEVIAWIS